MKSICIFVLSIFVLIGCDLKPIKVEIPASYYSFDPDTISSLGTSIAIIADNQFHLPTGDHYYLENMTADKFVDVAVRPPQSNLFGPYAFEILLNSINNWNVDLILHLGDAPDISCPQEFSNFLDIISTTSKHPWIFTPGNHDGYFTGNSQHKPAFKLKEQSYEKLKENGLPQELISQLRRLENRLYTSETNFLKAIEKAIGYEQTVKYKSAILESAHKPNTWDRTCGSDFGRLDKAKVVSEYVKRRYGTIIETSEKCDKDIDDSKITFGGDTFSTFDNKPQFQFAACVDNDSPHHSFVIQQIRFRISDNLYGRIILFDTAQYQKSPKYRAFVVPGVKVAGLTGEFLEKQKEIGERWINDAIQSRDVFIIGGHHTLKNSWFSEGVNWKNSKWIKKKLSQSVAPIYLSAHTHKGGMRKLSNNMYELNLPSLIDWPLGMRILNIQDSKVSSRELFFSSENPPHGITGSCKDICCSCNEFFSFTGYTKINKIDKSGRLMHYYILLAELNIIKNSIKMHSNMQNEETNKWIDDTESFLNKSKTIFDNNTRRKVLSHAEAKEIKKQLPEVKKAVELALKYYENMISTISPKERPQLDLYHWCQFSLAAESDYAIRTKTINSIGYRELNKDWLNINEYPEKE